jgi:mycothiol synthase
VIADRRRLSENDQAAVVALVEAATAADGVAPVSEQGVLRLRGATATTHLIVDAPGGVVGYAQLDESSGAAELVVHPLHRRRGVGRAMVSRLLAGAGGSTLKVWAHGDTPAAAALAAATGLKRIRSLWQMSRPLTGDLPAPRIPAGIVVDTFVPGVDDTDWVALNARAFADHPEQGSWTIADLHDRMAEPWFDPAGFFVARRGRSMVGFHWTKVHDDATGEVYVVAVAATEQGHGLGQALTLVGMHHLRQIGLERVILYVDESNHAAVRLYHGLGFERVGLDVMYATTGPTG